MITQFSWRIQMDNEFFSRPYYTSPQGYKMCLNVCAGGCGLGIGTHVSIYVYLLKGEYNDTLIWPFK